MENLFFIIFIMALFLLFFFYFFDVKNLTPKQNAEAGSDLLNLSAGELLGRTHEELVLLLIQLRRRHAATANAIEQCCTQIHAIQVFYLFFLCYFMILFYNPAFDSLIIFCFIYFSLI